MAWGGLTFSLVLIFLAMAALLLFRARSLQQQSGLPSGNVIYSDSGTWHPNNEPLLSMEQRLAGKPDYLVEKQNGEIIPVEIKSGQAPHSPWPGHRLQLAAYCWLVEETYGIRPSYGILQYEDQVFDVEYTTGLEEVLLDVMHEMRQDYQATDLDRTHEDAFRCASCGMRSKCRQRLA
ncbi:MAG: Dna2/Cas4 domain-containing protein [Chloroflexi bacterium]|nr:Dna2/Cas4 domain-containing protein [Chloroflexota bacterium]